MSNTADTSGLSKHERHDIIIHYLKGINKATNVFHLRWRPGDLLNGQILRSTPMFWYMKYEWTRQEIETMFFKSKIEIDALFDSSLQQVFGGKPGPRWKSNHQTPAQQQWRQRHLDNVQKWQTANAKNLKLSQKHNENQHEKKQESVPQNSNNLTNNKLAQNISSKSSEIWNAVSDFGADKCIDYKTFSDNLKDRGINVSAFLAKQLFARLAKPSGTMNKHGMEVLIKQLDLVQVPANSTDITWDDMATTLGTQLVMKRILNAAGSCQPFNVDDFIYASKFNVHITPIQYMNKLTDRDVNWNERMRAMEQLSANIGTNPLFNDVLAATNIPALLCGWSSQILDNKPEVQETAIRRLPDIFVTALSLSQGSPQSAINHLEQILSNLFKVLNDPNAARQHALIKRVVSEVVDQVININDPESILYLSGILSEKCDLENITSAKARLFAVEQLKKIMFENGDCVPKPGSVRREWLDVAANKQSSPVPVKNICAKYKRRVPPFAVLMSYPKEIFVNNVVDFDASKSRDGANKPCVEFAFDFGDGSERIIQKSPFVQHKYEKIGLYDVRVVVKDNSNETATAMVVERVMNDIGVENKQDDDNKYNECWDDLGAQFRGVVRNAFGIIVEDPNKDISNQGKKLIDIMKQLNPQWIDLLDGTAKKRYIEWSFPMKPYTNKDTMNAISLNKGTAEEHEIYNVMNVEIVSEYPDI